ncbi:hypothetical protein Back11_12100 [Paenibacillus baekrokdamisoli]|uniref:Uncharacterized protein n=1 Tax=Paenibacillus baekrokdamisoli TaxID=1712516 RepID=A0A3G9IUX1_9BACL|nr:DUF2634 domain-containing protein [Paenibacillus baekrokdamisoli]MBB3070516.1 hypothetical protein [Paenibacillus baekrokdamisoli]BBH19865.1 hypothetical protein Back11_12100 [Paenibacillus baekrokdamisoli]
MVLPIGGISAALQEVVSEPSLTYRLDPTLGRIVGLIDGLEAVKQSVYKILQTERFVYPIYSSNYGCELIRNDNITIEFERWITDALTQDDRIEGISDFEYTQSGDTATLSFSVESTFGKFNVSTGGGNTNV